MPAMDRTKADENPLREAEEAVNQSKKQWKNGGITRSGWIKL